VAFAFAFTFERIQKLKLTSNRQ